MSSLRNSNKKVLVLSHDTAGVSMAGPGIRYVSIAKQLSGRFDTTLGLLDGDEGQREELVSRYGLSVQLYAKNDFKKLFDESDYIFAQWLSADILHYAREKKKRIIFDLYSPVPIEFMLYRYFSDTGFGSLEKQELNQLINDYQNYAKLGDYFVCSNERQRDMWIGFFMANNILQTRQASLTNIEDIIGLCPMGIENNKPKHTKKVLRGVVPGIGPNDFILLWTGGLWDWFSPLTIVKAAEKASRDNPKIKLVFMGTSHPNKKMRYLPSAKKTISYVKKRGLENNLVFFIDDWVPYEQRINYLLEADAAIYAHKKSLETRFSHRSRVLDHIYAGLPTIANSGDYVSDSLLGVRNFGLVVNKNNSTSFAAAITKLASDGALYARIKKSLLGSRTDFLWESSLVDLVEYINSHTPTSNLKVKTSETHNGVGIFFQLRRVLRKIKRYVS